MLKLKLTNGKEYEYLKAFETEEFFNGSSRRTLTFEMARTTADLEELDTDCTETNCETIELTNTEMGITNIYDDYVLKLKVGVEPVLIQSESPENSAVYEDRIILKLGKRTYIEQQLKDLGVE